MWWYRSTKTAKFFWVILDGAMHGADLDFIFQWVIKIKKSKSKKNLYSAVYSTDSEALGGRIKWGRRNDTDKF